MFGEALLFTPRALGSLRKLRGENAESAETLLTKMAGDQPISCVKLKGHDGWFRARDGNNPMRVLWTWHEDPVSEEARVLVIEVGYRDSNFYSDAQRTTARSKTVVEVAFGDEPVPEVEDGEDEQHFEDGPDDWASWPAYEYAPEGARTQWANFLYRDFSLSPRLTKEQLGHFKTLIEEAAGQDRDVAVVQGGAGSGKSVCALLAACHLHRGAVPGLQNQRAHHVLYLAPERLTEKFRGFPEVRDTFENPEKHVRTVEDWFRASGPPEETGKPDESLEALREAARHYRQSGHTLRVEPDALGPTDALIYQAFVLGNPNAKDAAWQEYGERIEELSQLEGWWGDKIEDAGATSRTHLARALKEHPTAPPEDADYSLIVVDEAQDLLVEELRAIRRVWSRWNEEGHYTRLWLFGDLNQRITPSGFFWADLPDKVSLRTDPILFERNYRNTRQIVAFANRIHEVAGHLASDVGARALPPPSPENQCALEGDPVGVLRVEDDEAARTFMKRLERKSDTAYLREAMSSAAQVLCRNRPEGALKNTELVFHTPERIKGRELESCVGYGLFQGEGAFTPSEVSEWYTLVTRARTRLLIVLTEQEAERAPSDLFADCQTMTREEASEWVLAYGSAVQFAKSPEETWRRLTDMRPSGQPWRDTWEALLEADFSPAAWVRHMRHQLSETQHASLAEAQCPWLRALGFAWQEEWAQAERAAWTFREEKSAEAPVETQSEYRRLASNVAEAWQRGKRPYEAARLRKRAGLTGDWPEDYPLPALADSEKPLVPAVKGLIADILESPPSREA